MTADPVAEIHKQLEGMRKDLDALKAETVGDRNQIEMFKKTLRGRIEELEKSTEELVSQTEHKQLKEAVEGLSKTVKQATDVLKWAITAILGSALAALGLWLATRLLGGSA